MASATEVELDSLGSQRLAASFVTPEEESCMQWDDLCTGTAVIGRTRGWTRSRLNIETLLADINAVRNCKVAERTVVRMIRWTRLWVLLDKDLVTLMDRTLVSLDWRWRGVNSFTLWISTGIRATDS